MRLPDWRERLDAVYCTALTRSFAYGSFDCALFAADCAQAVTGHDYAEQLRGYDSKIAAYRIVAQYGSLEAMITALLERDPKPPAFATEGDVVIADIELAPGESGDCVGVCFGTRCAFPSIEGGLRMLPRSVAHLAWSIG